MHMELAPQEIRQFSESCRTWTAQCHFAVRSTCLLAALIAANSEISPLVVGFFGQPKKVKQVSII
jgi:hypothetical protein